MPASTPHAIVLREFGDPAVLRAEPIALAPPGPGEVRVRHTAIGVNFHDVYVRSGLYKTLALPGIPGLEAAGVIEALGEGVTDLQVGQRVAWLTRAYGGYASHRNLPAELALPLPDGVSERTAASSLLKALTAYDLTHQVHALRAGDWVLNHASAGGVGQLVAQYGRHLGATVIGTVGSAAKAEIARACGCDHVILYRDEDFVARVQALTAGRGVDVAYDAVGQTTFMGSLASLAQRGHLVNYGQSSGPVPPFEVSALMPKSVSLTRPSVFSAYRNPAELRTLATRVFADFAAGVLRADAPQTFALAEAGRAHEALASRDRTQALVLIPD
ncbi:quinone oxidoreductase [Comamonas serinivorans]|uniref:Quinone oxidoreductase n=1 Tax=Comamonas serinivorans TaxID=1082851 RepID=A0A1Y0ETD9_9BURK|nr:quinone oxidoreductase [Comamonas serinivorans]ARU06569.1 quinone oxidoreductase [Comamonas serinivorans]